MSIAAPEADISRSTVAGERAVSSAFRNRSFASRASSLLAVGLTMAIALVLLIWYYRNAWARHQSAAASGRSAAAPGTATDMPLPALLPVAADGATVQPAVVSPTASPDSSPGANLAVNSGPVNPGWMSTPVDESAPASLAAPASAPPGTAVPEAVRRLMGAAFATGNNSSAVLTDDSALPRSAVDSRSTPLGTLLEPGSAAGHAPAVPAMTIAAKQLLLPKGAFIDCTLETAIDSSLPGITTCITATDTFGVDGKVVLLERGTKLVGETRGEVQQGAARIFVLWTEARTPDGVLVPLMSPGTDELGRSGLPGSVERHFLERFGAAMLISTINGAAQAAVSASRGAGGQFYYNPSSSSDVLTEVLKSTISIAPTVTKQQGDRIQVLVARDLDFRSVYRLHTMSTEY